MAEKEKATKQKRPTALKRDIRNEKMRLINKAFKSEVRTVMRDFQSAVQTGDLPAIQARLSAVYSVMDKAVKKGVFKANKASRSKLRAAQSASRAQAA
ncbi:MAG: 30S ribosomal protein S20 [Verrucomicrobia bacterium]|nr:30S ribosomal protein S20 [Verrucomicrobiota bacterium]MBS0646157.1 30S ribosomal protein S20 [Verrucomicrobiota bacterium]